jgi:peptidoglycan/LPS O-acetylase OafA/YrhL
MMTPDQNSFGVMRLLLALAVVVSHSVYLTAGRVEAEPLFNWTGYTLGQHGVQGFFVLSGLLVAQSLSRSATLGEFASARALRIFPALIACVVATAFALGPLVTSRTVAAYVSDVGTLVYLAKTALVFSGGAHLPGVFETNPVPSVVNSSIWTLKYEILCYAILGLVGWVVLRSGHVRAVTLAAVGAWAMIALAAPVGIAASDGDKPALEVLRYFTVFFGVGVVFFLVRSWLPVSVVGVVMTAVVVWAARGSRFEEPAMALALGYALVWLSTFRFGTLRDVTNDSDYSYAIYLWHMPVAQALLVAVPEMGPIALMAATMAVTLPLAFLSWELIERPALALRHRFFARPEPGEIITPVIAEPESDAPHADPDPVSAEPVLPPVTPDRLARVTQARVPGRVQPGVAPPSIIETLNALGTQTPEPRPGRDAVLVPADNEALKPAG